MKKHLSLFALLLLLTACGFTPIYGDKGPGTVPVQASLSQIKINNIPGERGQFLRNKLIDRMYFEGRPTDPKAQLYVALSFTETDTGIQKDATSTRARLSMTAQFVLTSEEGAKEELFKGQASTVASYSKLDAQYGTIAAKRDAYKRALIEISAQIVNRLSLFYAEKAPYKQP